MKYYVYILSYNEIPFYVGKGSGSRMYSHVQTAKRNKSKHPVLSKIRKILANNENVEYSKIFFTDNAVEAYSKEIETIKPPVFIHSQSVTMMEPAGGGEIKNPKPRIRDKIAGIHTIPVPMKATHLRGILPPPVASTMKPIKGKIGINASRVFIF